MKKGLAECKGKITSKLKPKSTKRNGELFSHDFMSIWFGCSCPLFLVAKSNSIRGFVSPSVRRFSKTANSRKFNLIQQNSRLFATVGWVTALLAWTPLLTKTAWPTNGRISPPKVKCTRLKTQTLASQHWKTDMSEEFIETNYERVQQLRKRRIYTVASVCGWVGLVWQGQ